MLTNYIKIALRNLMKNKLFSFINISGMAIGLASCLLIGLFVRDELLFDRFHPDGDRTYRVYNIANQSDGTSRYLPIVPYPFASYMQKDFPEIESTLRMMDMYGELLFEGKGKKMMEPNGLYAEPSVFDMLTLNVVFGNAADALSKPNTIALSSTLARKYFGDTNPLGETIKANNEVYEIKAVFSDPPKHLHM
jgi:putative ABC transport system permease protein